MNDRNNGHNFHPNQSWAGISKINKVENVRYKNIMLGLRAGIFIVIALVIFGIIDLGRSFTIQMPEFVFVIKEGDGVSEIAKNLKQQGVIKNETVFKGYVALKNAGSKLKSGTYYMKDLKKGRDGIGDLVGFFVRGVKPKEITATFIEGWTIDDMDAYLLKFGVIKPGELRSVASSQFIADMAILSQGGSENLDFPDFLREKYKRNIEKGGNEAEKAAYTLEGYLFPDTYQFFENVTPREIIKKMLNTFDKKFTKDMRVDALKAGRTIDEIVIMASVLEKEVQTPSDKAKVADIFWRRIKRGMPLQADATVNYVIKGDNPSLTLEQTKVDSLYNTYWYPGLPIAPISNPGLDSIKAAIYPEENQFWYYLSKPDGETVFGKTLEEHNANKQKFLK